MVYYRLQALRCLWLAFSILKEYVMKKPGLLILLLVLGISFADAAGSRGNGKIAIIEKDVSPFETMQISGRSIVNYYRSREYRVVVTIDSNLEKRLDIATKNNTLNIGLKAGYRVYPSRFVVDVYSPALSGITISGNVQFEARDTITAGDFRLNVSGNGRIGGNFQCESFTTNVSGSVDIESNVVCRSFSADISGSGRITLTGDCNDLDIAVSGSGTFDGDEFKTNNAVVRISGSARINIWVLEYLRANVYGSGRVRYRGNPKIDFSGSGSGQLENV